MSECVNTVQGDSISTHATISSPFTKKVDPKDPNRSWDSIVMISDLDRDLLPRNLSQQGAQQLCVINSNLAGVNHSDMTKKRKPKGLFFHGKKFYEISFEVRAIVAPADLRFELWFAGQKFSGSHEPIKITWDREGAKVGAK